MNEPRASQGLLAGELSSLGAEARQIRGPSLGEADLMEFAEGRVSNVFGAGFDPVDAFPRRVRLPSPPFLAISRVTELIGTPGELKGARICTEYDIPMRAWNAIDDQVSYLCLDPQGVLVLVAWLGIDFESQGRRAYRWVDAEITYRDNLPRVGQRVRYQIALTHSIRMGESRIVRAVFYAEVNGRRILDARRVTVGFFSDDALDREGEWVPRRTPRAKSGEPFAVPLEVPRAGLGSVDLVALSRGRIAEVMSPAHAVEGRNPSLRLPPPILQFIDRVVSISATGGACGLGSIEAEWRVDPMHWAVRAHFKDDPILAGPCLIEGAIQVLKIYALSIGLQKYMNAARFEPAVNTRVTVRFGAQIRARGQTLRYCAEIVNVQIGHEPCVVADVEILDEYGPVGRIEGLGVRLVSGAV